MMGNATNSRTSPFWERKAAMDRAVNEVFDELIREVSIKPRLHSSEQFNRTSQRGNSQNNAKLYDFINPYHAFCRLCEQHFYTRSVPEDINSFFQKHINTPYHRQLRTFDSYPDDLPILTWEEYLQSGRCNICELSGLDAFVIKTRFCVKKLMFQHLCVWSWDERDTNDKFVKKLSLLKKYCGLKVFEQKFLKPLDKKVICMLCGVSLSWSMDKAPCHLKSDLHYQKFCMFIWMNFGFAPKDILNGYNLEIVTRWLLLYEPPLWNKILELNELPACISDTNNFTNPYPDDRQSNSYSPAYVGMLLRDEEVDFVFRDKCLLCGVDVVPGHFSTAMHRGKALDPSEDILTPENCMIYLENRERRLMPYLRIISKYEKLRRDQKGDKMFLPVLTHYIKWLLARKLPLVDKAIFPVNDKEIFCHVCDLYMDKCFREPHLESFEHSSHLEKWSLLRKDSSSEQFLESFKIVKNVVVCLLCGTLIHTNSFFAHLKSATHTLRLGLYISLNLDVPVCNSLEFRDDLTCCCNICDCLLGTRNSFMATLSAIKTHWPCPRFEEVRRLDIAISDDPEAQESEECYSEQSKDSPLVHNNFRADKQLQKVVRVVESEAKVMGEEVANVLDSSPHLRSRLANKKVGCRPSKKKVLQVNWMDFVDGERASGCFPETTPPSTNQTSTTPMPSTTGNEDSEISVGEDRREGVQRREGVRRWEGVQRREGVQGREGVQRLEEVERRRNEMRNISTEDDNTSEHEEEEEEDEDEEEEYDYAGDEVLLIKDLSRKKRKCRVLYSKFQSFGSIRYVMFYNKAAVVAFAERGVADLAAAAARRVLEDPNVKAEVTERKLVKKKAEAGEKAEELIMPQEMIQLLADPRKLVKFVKNLNFQASTQRRAGEDTRKEEIVCNMIIRAILDRYPRARCYPFGSRLTGMSLSNSDLDVFIDCGGMYDGSRNTTPGAERRLVRTMADCLRKVKEVRDITVIDRARVPIVSFFHQPTETHCDLSFKNGLGVQNSLLIRFLLTLDWRVKPVILFIKHWAKTLGLHGPPHFSSYALSMLVINYFEQLEPPVLPTIESLQDSFVGRRLTIGGWDCSISTNNGPSSKLTNNETLLTLILGFFEFYENFDFTKNVVFPLTGRALPREAFSEAGRHRLPLCFKRSALNLPMPLEHMVSTRFPICIIDPFDLSHVLTKSFNFEGLMQFVFFCQMSRQYMRNGMSDRFYRP